MWRGTLTRGNSATSGSGNSGMTRGTSGTRRGRAGPGVPVVVRSASALAAGVERVAAAAGGGGVGVLDREAAAHQVFLVVDLGALEVAQAHGIHDDLDTFLLEDLVALGGLVEHHPVGKARAAAALDVDPQAALGDAGLLLLEDALDLLRGRVGDVDHPIALLSEGADNLPSFTMIPEAPAHGKPRRAHL